LHAGSFHRVRSEEALQACQTDTTGTNSHFVDGQLLFLVACHSRDFLLAWKGSVVETAADA
jgi:hypothetical protein